MPVRRLNYTERQRIAHRDVVFTLQDTDDGSAVFDASINLAPYRFPADARVFVEAYRQTTLLRFDFGTVSVLTPPKARSLAVFEAAVEALFRVKVTAVSGRHGVLLGEADQIRPVQPEEEPDNRIPLLPPIPDDLGEEAWRIEFDNSSTLLKVNNRFNDWKATVRSPAFQAFVYPVALRQILERILLIENTTFSEDPQDWRSRWLMFASRLPGSGQVPSARDDIGDWIDNAVAAFSRRFRLCSSLIKEGDQ